MKWYAEQIDALRAENERLRSEIIDLVVERDQLRCRNDELLEDALERWGDE
jgi:uncharacterized coiled-coil DUF342 family protein